MILFGAIFLKIENKYEMWKCLGIASGPLRYIKSGFLNFVGYILHG